MAQARSTASLEVKVGLLVVAGLIAFVALVLASDRISFERSYRVQAFLQDAGGLNPGSPVTLSGIRIGSVEDIVASGGDPRGPIRVRLVLSAGTNLYENMRLVMNRSGIFGDSYLAFSAPEEYRGEPLPTDGSAAFVADSTFLDRAMIQVQTITEGVAEVFGPAGRHDMRRMMAGGADAAEALAQLAGDLQQTRGRVDALVERLDRLVTGLDEDRSRLAESATNRIDQLGHSLQAVDQAVVAIADQAGTAAQALGTLAQRMDTVLADSAGDIQAGIAEMRGLAAHLRAVAGEVHQGRGVIGQMLVNPAMAKDLNDALITAAQLVERLAQRPEILLWGSSRAESAAAASERARRKMRRSFLEGFQLHHRQGFAVEQEMRLHSGEEATAADE